MLLIMSYRDLLNQNQGSPIKLNAYSFSCTNITTADRLALNPPNGTMVYDVTLNAFFFFENSNWYTFSPQIVPSLPGSGKYTTSGGLLFNLTGITPMQVFGSTGISIDFSTNNNAGPIIFDTNTGNVAVSETARYFMSLNLSTLYAKVGGPATQQITVNIKIQNLTQAVTINEFDGNIIVRDGAFADFDDSTSFSANGNDVIQVQIILNPDVPSNATLTFGANDNALNIFSIPN